MSLGFRTPDRSTAGTARLLAALLLAGPLALGVRADGARAGADDARAELAAILAASVAGERAVLLVIEDLAHLDPVPVAELFDAFHRRRIPIGEARDTDTPELELGPRETGLLRVTFGRVEWTPVRAFLADLAQRDDDVARRSSALIVLGDVGTLSDVHLLAQLATAPLDERANARVLREGFERSLSAILRRDPGPWGALSSVFRDVPVVLRMPIARALAQTHSEPGLLALVGLLHRVPEMDALVLHEVVGMLDESELEADELVLATVRGMLDARPATVVQAAAGVLGALRDEQALPELMGLLQHDDANVRGAVQRALHAISGLSLGQDQRAWSAWYAKEQKSRAKRLSTLANDLYTGDPRAVAAALNELSRLRTGREDVAEMVAGCLRHEQPDVVRIACAALAQLRQPTVLPDLVACLDHVDPGVRDAAWSALKRISGLDLAPERDAWLAELARDRR